LRKGKAYRTIKQGIEENPLRPLPPEFEDVPELDDLNTLYWDLFWELSTERLVEMGPIPGSKIIYYAKEFGLNYDDLQMVIRAMDGTYLEYVSEERNKVTGKHKSEPSTNKTPKR